MGRDQDDLGRIIGWQGGVNMKRVREVSCDIRRKHSFDRYIRENIRTLITLLTNKNSVQVHEWRYVEENMYCTSETLNKLDSERKCAFSLEPDLAGLGGVEKLKML